MTDKQILLAMARELENPYLLAVLVKANGATPNMVFYDLLLLATRRCGFDSMKTADAAQAIVLFETLLARAARLGRAETAPGIDAFAFARRDLVGVIYEMVGIASTSTTESPS